MTFEEFDPKITPGHSVFNDLHECHAVQNIVIERNLQFEILMVSLSTIWRMLSEDSEQNHQLSSASSYSCCQLKNSYSTELKLSLECINNDSDFIKMEHVVKERRRIKNMLSILINNYNLENNSINDSTLKEVYEELFWLVQEYYRLSSLPNLTDSDTKRMLLILELAQVDPQLDDFITKIDAAIAEEVGLMDNDLSTDATTAYNSTKEFKEVFIQYLEQNLTNLDDVE